MDDDQAGKLALARLGRAREIAADRFATHLAISDLLAGDFLRRRRRGGGGGGLVMPVLLGHPLHGVIHCAFSSARAAAGRRQRVNRGKRRKASA